MASIAEDDPHAPQRGPRATEIEIAAARLFYEEGYGQVGMRAIADAVGIKTSSLYNHFVSKEEILYTFVKRINTDFIDRHIDVLSAQSRRPAVFRQLIIEHILYFWEQKYEMQAGVREMKSLSPEHLAEVTAIRRTYQVAIAAFIAAGVEDGEFVCDDPKLAALAVLDMINGIDTWFRESSPFNIEELATSYAELITYNLLGGTKTGGNP